MTEFSPAVIDAAARAICEENEMEWDDARKLSDPDIGTEAEAYVVTADMALAAAFGVMAPCPNCGGIERWERDEGASYEAGTPISKVKPCPDHREPVPQLLLDLWRTDPETMRRAGEAAGVIEPAGRLAHTFTDQQAVFRFVSPEDQQ